MKIIGINVKTNQKWAEKIIQKQTLAFSIHSEKMSLIYISQLKNDSPKSLMFSLLKMHCQNQIV